MDDDWEKRAIMAIKFLLASGGCQGYYLPTGHNCGVRLHTSPYPCLYCSLDVIDTTVGRNGLPIFFLYKARKALPYFDHVNINPKIYELLHDPYLSLPPGDLIIEFIEDFCKAVNKVALPVAVTLVAIEIGWSIYTDATNGTTRNTVESIAGVAGGWGVGYGGAAAGAAVGTAILQEVGTIVGGIVGGLRGGIGGAFGARAVAEANGDYFDYDIEEMPCQRCGRNVKVREYREERNHLCPEWASLQ